MGGLRGSIFGKIYFDLAKVLDLFVREAEGGKRVANRRHLHQLDSNYRNQRELSTLRSRLYISISIITRLIDSAWRRRRLIT